MQINQDINEKYAPLYVAGPEIRYFFLIGGRSAGRSKVVGQYIVSELVGDRYFRCALMRLILADVRNSIYQEVVDVINEYNGDTGIQGMRVRDNDMILNYGQNMAKGMGFKAHSGDQKSKMKSLAGYSFVAIEEADEISEEEFMKLDDSLRTKKGPIKICFMMNAPHKNHWIMRRFFNLIPAGIEGYYRYELKSDIRNAVLMNTDYRDNIKNINQSTIDNFRSYKKSNPEYYWNMIMGYVSEGSRGRIFTDWERISAKEFEELPYPKFYGLDFGFTNDPTSLVEIKEHNEKVWARQLIYETGLNNRKIAERMELLGVSKDDFIYADSAEPKSIDELYEFGYNVVGAVKGADSIIAGIDLLKTKKVFYTEDSTDIDTESQEYKWALDRNKEPTNTPVDHSNHAMDAIRYGVYTNMIEMKSQGNVRVL